MKAGGKSGPGRKHMAHRRVTRAAGWLLTALVALGGSAARAQDASQPKPDAKPTFDIYGFAMLDIGHNFTQIDPAWTDTLRVVKLPKVEKEFGENNSTFAGVRQSRLGFKS